MGHWGLIPFGTFSLLKARKGMIQSCDLVPPSVRRHWACVYNCCPLHSTLTYSPRASLHNSSGSAASTLQLLPIYSPRASLHSSSWTSSAASTLQLLPIYSLPGHVRECRFVLINREGNRAHNRQCTTVLFILVFYLLANAL
jgi:hypothetical protein